MVVVDEARLSTQRSPVRKYCVWRWVALEGSGWLVKARESAIHWEPSPRWQPLPIDTTFSGGFTIRLHFSELCDILD